MKRARKPNTMEKLFELASGWRAGDYLHDRVMVRGWKMEQVMSEGNGWLAILYNSPSFIAEITKAKILWLNRSILTSWYKIHGIKSQVTRGPKVSQEVSHKASLKKTKKGG